MESKMQIRNGVQVIVTMPAPNTVKRGNNPVSGALRSPAPNSIRAQNQRNKRERSMSKLMNCKSVDKFDFVKVEHPKMQKTIPQRRLLSVGEIRAWIRAGAEIHVDPWKHTREIVYRNRILGSCTQADVVSLVKDGVAERYPVLHGFYVYRCK